MLGGAGTIVSNLSRELQDQFDDVTIHAITSKNFLRGKSDKPLPSKENWNGIIIHRLNAPPTKRDSGLTRLILGLLFTLMATIKLLQNPRYDVIIATTNPPMISLAGQLLRLFKRTPYVYLVHDLYAEMAVALGLISPDSKAMRVSQKLQSSFLRKSSTVIALGRCMKQHLDTTFALPPQLVQVIPNWGTLGSVIKQEESAFRKAQGLQNQFVVLYAGNFGQFHNFDNIIDAARSISLNRKDISFVMVGGGAKKPEVELRITAEKIDNVKLLGFVPHEELADMLASANVSLITLERGTEGLAVPCKFYNILASGRASIAIMDNKAETARVIEEENCGICVPQDDSQALVDALISLADDPERVQQMGENARRSFELHYTLSVIAARFYHVLTQIASKRS
ncbi:Glycosyltransferase involved in cell wall bisynthesis [Abditibacterium utsteinense]|uniref:Glycosyltransferase involved in cell wall bisynthesis n=2 Tax=Abditibacterium utsteinense TaxID=1960156 RepID=A0A2S8SNW1_9BACT|nr:Glycosyltransferase involved in cell wall bisynthesis [Abditibacterium utsteinense]